MLMERADSIRADVKALLEDDSKAGGGAAGGAGSKKAEAKKPTAGRGTAPKPPDPMYFVSKTWLTGWF